MHSLRALHQQLRTGAVRARDLAEGALAAMTHDAYRAVDPDRVRAAAEAADAALSVGADPGPLAGIPVSVKDLYGVPGYPTSAGTGVDLPERFTVPGPLIRRALDQLAVVTGKTHTVEFAFGGIGTDVDHNHYDDAASSLVAFSDVVLDQETVYYLQDVKVKSFLIQVPTEF